MNYYIRLIINIGSFFIHKYNLRAIRSKQAKSAMLKKDGANARTSPRLATNPTVRATNGQLRRDTTIHMRLPSHGIQYL
jgi:hypothetical protein